MGLAVQGGSVSFDELSGSPTFKGARDFREGIRRGKIFWSDIDALFSECFPTAPSLPGVCPGISYLYAVDLDVKPFHPEGVPTQVTIATYDYAEATVGYSSRLYDPSDLLTRRYGFSGEFLTLPAAGLFWQDTGLPVDQEEISAAKIIPTIEHSLTRNRVTSIPWASIQANIGKVNQNSLNNTYFSNIPSECLLFMGAEISFVLSTDGSTVWTCELRFQERRVKQNSTTYGWNHFLRGAGADTEWVKLMVGPHPALSTDELIYDYSGDDFAGLFT